MCYHYTIPQFQCYKYTKILGMPHILTKSNSRARGCGEGPAVGGSVGMPEAMMMLPCKGEVFAGDAASDGLAYVRENAEVEGIEKLFLKVGIAGN